MYKRFRPVRLTEQICQNVHLTDSLIAHFTVTDCVRDVWNTCNLGLAAGPSSLPLQNVNNTAGGDL